MKCEERGDCRVILVRNVKEYRRIACKVLKSGDHVLEVGCSFGKTLEKIVKTGCKVLGIDKSVDAVKKARARLTRMSNVKVELMDAFDIKA
ncbi:MAG: SAM-dependent methyltransferase, partial [Candidatus Nezhaarchaeales archaeon]